VSDIWVKQADTLHKSGVCRGAFAHDTATLESNVNLAVSKVGEGKGSQQLQAVSKTSSGNISNNASGMSGTMHLAMPHEELPGIQRVSNPSTENKRISQLTQMGTNENCT